MDHSEHKSVTQYMVEFTIPTPLPDDMFQMIPQQREEVDNLFTAGRLLSYTLSVEKNKLWAVFLASSESELLSYIDQLPLSKYIEYNYYELMFHQSLKLLPSMSLN